VISNPRQGQTVRVRYAVKPGRVKPWDWRSGPPGRHWLTIAPRFQDAVGRVLVPSRGRPRNHLVKIAGELVVVHAGNLMPMVE
jgi:hypothetical protein